MWGATAKTEIVATTVKAEKKNRQSRSRTMAANFQSASTAPDTSSSLILSVITRISWIFVQILIFKELCKNGCVIERWHRSSPIKKSMNFKLYLFYFWTCIIWLIAYRAVCFKTQFNPIWGRVENIRYVAGDECSTPPLLNTENHCDPTPTSNRVKEIGPSIIWHCNLIFSVDSVDLLCKLFYATEMLKVRKQRTLFSRHNYVPSVMAIVVLYCS